MADALDHAHRHGVLHCDIKPANVLLAPDGQARLLDFNVSLEDSQASSQMRFGGTLAYMAPEHLAAVQGKGEPRIDARSDIYSLGIVLFEMLSGTVPKQQASDGNIPVRQLLRAANPAVTPALAAIVHKCLANDPDQRYSSAGQLYEDLNAQCNSLPLVHQAEPSIVERTNKWVRRHPLLTSVSSTSLVAASLMLLTLVGFVWRGRQLERLERASRGSRLEQLLPDAISLASATRNYPELADQARAKSMEVLSLLDNQNDHTLDLSILADQTPLQTLVRLSKANQPEERLHELKDKSESDSATDSYSSDMKRLEAAVEDLNLREVASDEILDAYLEGRFADVTELGTQLSGARASDYATWMFLGQSNLKLENFAAARECFSVCVTLRPSLEIAWFYRGIARLESKQHAAAIADFSHAIELKPDFPSASYNLALAYQAQGETESALQSLNQAINSGWRSVSGFAFRSQLYAKLGMQAESEQDLNNALACRPTSELDWVRRGTLRLSSDLAGAKQDFEQAVAINPRSILARQNLAHVLAEKLAQPEASLEHLDALTELDASNAERWASRGVVLARLGRLTSALRDLSHASTLKMSEALVAYQVACGYSLIASQMDDGPSEILTGLPSQSQIGAAAVKWYKYSLQLRPDVSQIAMTDNDVAWLRNQPEYLELIQSTKSTSRD
ncbi:MAG: tetratricopeptide repeat protein [Pirellulaceae bacterium]|nr:tetratricopeptide repeat protein [Pirellulaceae bacterium]